MCTLSKYNYAGSSSYKVVVVVRIALNSLDKVCKYLGTGIGIVFITWEASYRRRETRGFQGEARAQVQPSILQERNKAAYL